MRDHVTLKEVVMPDVVSFAELDEQHVELLPPRTLLTEGLGYLLENGPVAISLNGFPADIFKN